MDTTSDRYSKLNTDSRWRWVPLTVLMPFCGLLLLADLVGDLSLMLEFGGLVLVLLLMIVSWFKVGSGDAGTVAQVHAEATGGVRVNSHPILSRTLFILGCMLLAVLIVRWVWLDHVPLGERVGWERLAFAPLLPAYSMFLIVNGWRRPWDLQVVQREQGSSGSESMLGTGESSAQAGPWMAIYSGPSWAAYAVQSLLQDAGLVTYLPDENNRVLNPDLFAGGAFLLQVCVPKSAAESARSLIASSPYAAT